MKARLPLLFVATVVIAAYGINSAMFTELSSNMAASVGLSLDEVERVKVGFMIAQILGYMFTPILARRIGSQYVLSIALSVSLAVSAIFYWHGVSEGLFAFLWLCNGFAMSALLVVVNLYLLERFEHQLLPAIIAFTLLFSTLLPMGIYPWLMAQFVEYYHWSLFCVVSAWLLFSALVATVCFPLGEMTIAEKLKSSFSVYLVLAVTAALSVFLLMRGSHYNWLDSQWFANWVVVASALGLAVIFILVRTRSLNTASMQLHDDLKTNVFMYNAFLAGFAVMASTALFNNFLKMALAYNSLNAGYWQLPSFMTMLVGMLLSVVVFYFKRPLADAFVPFGVLMILLSVYDFSQLPSYVGTDALLVPMLLRGFGIGLLNVSVTIAVLLHFKPQQRLEGISNFYLFRTFGGVIGGAFFSRVIQNHSAQASGEIGRTFASTSNGFANYEQALSSAILTNGHIPTSSLGMSQMSMVVKEQATTLALNNSLIVFIFSIVALAPVLLIGKKIVAKRAKQAAAMA
ncbi:MFS transporter [Vibrio fluminensis]|uniref:MFS transporter n=1 Tax=Vibrio fluminensis TaxID=2783614 RepID=UPI001887A910|nr:MFS transporter [Vibrio fluminensis]